MFGKKSDGEKLTEPRPLPGIVDKYMVDNMKVSPECTRFLRAVIRASNKGNKAYDVRVFDEGDAKGRDLKIENFLTLNEHPELILYEGWYDESVKKTEIIEKKKCNMDTILYTEQEIAQKIETLKEPGIYVYFYQARGPGHGGPLGMGCALIELNPAYDGKKQKKYNIYFANVVDGKPSGNRNLACQMEKVTDAAKYVKDAHVKREYAS